MSRYKKYGGSHPKALEALHQAIKQNPHVLEIMTYKRELEGERPKYIGQHVYHLGPDGKRVRMSDCC